MLAPDLPGESGTVATVGDVLREVFPSGTVCLAGQNGLTRRITSAVALHLRGGFTDLMPGAVAVISLELLRQLPARPSLSQAIDALGRLGVAAIAVRGRIEPYELPIAARLADRWSCVLLQLPDTKEGTVSLVEAKVTTHLTSARGGSGLEGRHAREGGGGGEEVTQTA